MIQINKIKDPFIYYCQKVIPLAFDESLSYYEQLCHLTAKIKEVIDEQNIEGQAIEELQNKYLLLVDYVDHYFDNLDVQEEINNKLDEMALDGTLENLIGQYIQLATTYVYNNVDEMKNATNLVNGSFARTSGFYNYKDGGGAFYKIRNITNEDIVDDMFIIALDDENLIAEYLVQKNTINVLQFGCKGNDEFDNTEILQYLIEVCEQKGYVLIIPHGYYLITDTLYINSKITINGIGNPRLWQGISKHSCITGYLTDRPFIHIALNDTLYNWDSSGSQLVEGVHLNNLRFVGNEHGEDYAPSITGVYGSMYLSSIKNCTFNGFLNDLALASCYETIVENVQLMGSRQNLVLFNNNDTTIIKDVYCNGGQDESDSVIEDTNYIAKYTKNHKYNYCCVYINLGKQYFDNLAVEASCYGMIIRDSNTYIDKYNMENIRDCGIEVSVNLNTNTRTDIDKAYFYNPNSYTGCKLFDVKYLSKLNIKTINAFPISNYDEGDIGSRAIGRLYSYLSGEKTIELTLSNNVTGATIVNNSHYTENGFKIDYLIKGASSWLDNISTKLTGLPTSNSFGNSDYVLYTNPTLTQNSIINIRIYGNGDLLFGSGSWLVATGDNLKYVHLIHEYKIT